MTMKFYKCQLCGQIIGMVKETGVPIICCGQEMEEIIPHADEKGLSEKHIPVYKIKNKKIVVRIGSIPHPMTNEHYIEWVALVTNQGNQKKSLKPGDAPEVRFVLDDGEIVEEIYAYCNLHSLWKIKLI